MQGIYIDPFKRKSSPIEYEGKPSTFGEFITEVLECRYFDVARLYHVDDYDYVDDHVYIDDEGLYREDQMFWMHRNYPVPLAGCGLLFGGDHEGNTVNVATSIDTVKEDVRFIGGLFEVKLMMTLASGNGKNRRDWQEDYRPFVFSDKLKIIMG